MYDPAIGRFAQADSIVPGGVQGLDRYAYVNNSPVRYTDPSGHSYCESKYALAEDCTFVNAPKTFDDFDKMTWSERKDWLRNFVQEHNLGDWFNDIEGAIDYMAADNYFNRDGSTAEVMDAGVLQAINDGWLIHTGQDPIGGGGQGWADFFDMLQPRDGSAPTATQQELNVARLRAEQMGVDWAYKLPEVQSAIANASVYEQIYFADFKGWADFYRTLGINGGGVICPICAGNIDPRKTGDLLVSLSTLLPYQANLEYSWYLYPIIVRYP
jgi:hypothetical protein